MRIITVKDGKMKLVSYGEEGDTKTVQSKEPAAPEWNEAFRNLALDIKTCLANQLNVATALRDAFIQAHSVTVNKVHFNYEEDEETPSTYDVYGHHSISETNYDTDVKLTFEFGNSNAPDAGAIAVLKEGKKYALNHRAQVSLFEDAEINRIMNNGGDKNEE